MRRNIFLGAIAAPLILTLLSACGGSGDDGPSITVYNAQHEELLAELAPAFTKETGIKVKLRNGSDFELANQLVQEGDASPADVFLTENSPAMSLVESKDLFAKLDASTLELVPAQYQAKSGRWMGFTARSTVLVYNKAKVAQSELPTSLLDLAEPKWKGKVSFSPTGADFQAIVSAVLELEGKAATEQWLAGLKANGTVYQGNNVVLKEVNAGTIDTGVIYHYYWYRDQQESGANSDASALHFFGDKDPGAFLSVSGAGVLKASKHQSDAQKFVNFLASVDGQQALADSYALEYPLNPDVELGRGVRPLAELDPPVVDVSSLNGPEVISMLQDAGFL
ncbi:MAG: iron transporter substrate-binding protein [Aeromicrobium sp.]|uniref:iron ABC transporter substrate-binding protein n=1 Tax=Aeromicrobium sp. TaxID=1871063 RepID=UPI002614E394|nr:iron ABC transporter substrate-binding protein [Aeromicrobium sp.]MCW2824203.1 iron transporter substrate-binding protein [Aeromicrobium sp.]